MRSKGSFTGIYCGNCYFVTNFSERCHKTKCHEILYVRTSVCVGGEGGDPNLAAS